MPADMLEVEAITWQFVLSTHIFGFSFSDVLTTSLRSLQEKLPTLPNRTWSIPTQAMKFRQDIGQALPRSLRYTVHAVSLWLAPYEVTSGEAAEYSMVGEVA